MGYSCLRVTIAIGSFFCVLCVSQIYHICFVSLYICHRVVFLMCLFVILFSSFLMCVFFFFFLHGLINDFFCILLVFLIAFVCNAACYALVNISNFYLKK